MEPGGGSTDMSGPRDWGWGRIRRLGCWRQGTSWNSRGRCLQQGDLQSRRKRRVRWAAFQNCRGRQQQSALLSTCISSPQYPWPCHSNHTLQPPPSHPPKPHICLPGKKAGSMQGYKRSGKNTKLKGIMGQSYDKSYMQHEHKSSVWRKGVIQMRRGVTSVDNVFFSTHLFNPSCIVNVTLIH